MARRVTTTTRRRGLLVGPRSCLAATAVGVIGVVGAGCAAEPSTVTPVVDVPETVAIGGLPGPFSDTATPATIPSTSTSTTTEPPAEPISGPLVDAVLGHRLLLVGDTALAATTPRFDGEMCAAVTHFGWDVEIEAEPGRFVDFADEVLDARLDDDWDVVGLMFGHHVATTVDDFERTLDDLLDRLAPRPVILYTVAELGDDQVEINRLLRARDRSRPNVVIVDWAGPTSDDPELLLDDGGPYPTDEGARRLALFTAAALGETPSGDPGECLDAVFTDDSAIVI